MRFFNTADPVIFDRRPHTPWEEKIFQHREVFQGRAIMVWGM